MAAVSRQFIGMLALLTVVGAGVGLAGLVDGVDDSAAVRTAYAFGLVAATFAAGLVLRFELERRRQAAFAESEEGHELASQEHQHGHLVIEAVRLTVRIRNLLPELSSRLEVRDEGGDPRIGDFLAYGAALLDAADDITFGLLVLDAEREALALVEAAEELRILLPPRRENEESF